MASKYARRHYEDTARILKATRGKMRTAEEINARRVWYDIHAHYVDLFVEDNDRFDAERFNIACGIEV